MEQLLECCVCININFKLLLEWCETWQVSSIYCKFCFHMHAYSNYFFISTIRCTLYKRVIDTQQQKFQNWECGWGSTLYFLYGANFAALNDHPCVGFCIPHLIPVNANVHIHAGPVTLTSLRGSHVKRLPDLIMSVTSILGRRTLTYWLWGEKCPCCFQGFSK